MSVAWRGMVQAAVLFNVTEHNRDVRCWAKEIRDESGRDSPCMIAIHPGVVHSHHTAPPPPPTHTTANRFYSVGGGSRPIVAGVDLPTSFLFLFLGEAQA